MWPNSQMPVGNPGQAKAQNDAGNAFYAGMNPNPAARGISQTIRDRTADYANAAANTSGRGVWLALLLMAVVAVAIAWKASE